MCSNYNRPKKITQSTLKKTTRLAIWSLTIGSFSISCCIFMYVFDFNHLKNTGWIKADYMLAYAFSSFSSLFIYFMLLVFSACFIDSFVTSFISTFSVHCFLSSSKCTFPVLTLPFKHICFYAAPHPLSVYQRCLKRTHHCSVRHNFITCQNRYNMTSSMTYKVNMRNNIAVINF